MKKNLIIPCLLAIIIPLSGCATKGYNRAENTSASLQHAAARVDTSVRQVDLVLASLSNLVNQAGADLKPQFGVFSSEIRKLESLSREINSKAQKIQKQGAAYFKTWDEELAKIQNEELRNSSAQRKTEVMAQFDKVRASYEVTQNALAQFLAELEDIRRAMSVDLTPRGISAIKTSVATAQTDGAIVRDSLSKLQADFRELGATLSAAAPPPAG